MGNFQGVEPAANLPFGLFLVRRRDAFNAETLFKLYSFATQAKTSFALERLFKGMESVFVIYAPLNIIDLFPELSLLQLESYLPPQENTFGWQIAPKQNPKKKLAVSPNFLKDIHLEKDQQFFWQIVCSPEDESGFGVTIRAMVADSAQLNRIELAKSVDKHILESTGLTKQAREQSTGLYYEEYQKRVFTPKETTFFALSAQEVLELLG